MLVSITKIFKSLLLHLITNYIDSLNDITYIGTEFKQFIVRNVLFMYR